MSDKYKFFNVWTNILSDFAGRLIIEVEKQKDAVHEPRPQCVDKVRPSKKVMPCFMIVISE